VGFFDWVVIEPKSCMVVGLWLVVDFHAASMSEVWFPAIEVELRIVSESVSASAVVVYFVM